MQTIKYKHVQSACNFYFRKRCPVKGNLICHYTTQAKYLMKRFKSRKQKSPLAVTLIYIS